MKWKEMLLGGIITLIITLTSFYLIDYYQENKISDALPPLEYRVTQNSEFAFEFENIKRQFIEVEVTNRSNKIVENVILQFTHGKNNRILAKNYNSSLGSVASLFNLAQLDNEIILEYKKLQRNESIYLQVLINGKTLNAPKIAVRSDAGVGVPYQETAIETDEIDEKIIAILATIIILNLYYLFLKYREKKIHASEGYRSFSDTFISLNNASFSLLHSGLINEAYEMLKQYIEINGASAYEYSNYALTLALREEPELADSYIEAAEWLTDTDHTKAVILFNKGLISLKKKENDLGETYLTEAQNISQDISEYIKKSKISQQLGAGCFLLKPSIP